MGARPSPGSRRRRAAAELRSPVTEIGLVVSLREVVCAVARVTARGVACTTVWSRGERARRRIHFVGHCASSSSGPSGVPFVMILAGFWGGGGTIVEKFYLYRQEPSRILDTWSTASRPRKLRT